MTDKSKWFCSKDVTPDKDKKVIVKYFRREESNEQGIDYFYNVRYGIGEYREDEPEDSGICFLIDNIDDSHDRGSDFLDEDTCFRDIDENGDIVHFVYWRYLDE